MQKQEKWGVVMVVPGQHPKLLKHQFAEKTLAERCCGALRRHVPSAQFAVKLVGAIALQCNNA